MKFRVERCERRKLLVLAVVSLAAAQGLVATTVADDEIVSGFYAATQSACFETTGQLFHCRGGQCLFQEYQSSVATNQPVTADVTATSHPRIDRNGFDLSLGDAVLKYQQSGADTLRVVRSNGRTITTTNLARTDRYGAVTFAFIENNVSKDPAFRPQLLSRCEAYDVSEIEQIVANGAPPGFPRIETLVPPGLPLEFEYSGAANERSGVIGDLPILATAPREDAFIWQIVPVRGKLEEYPDLMVLWTVSPGTPTPIQILSYDERFKAYVDKTADLMAEGSDPLVDNPHEALVGNLVDGRPSVFLANGGIDAKPWTGSLDTLLVLNTNGQWEDRSNVLPRRKGWSDAAALGQITPDGKFAVYVSKLNSTPDAGSQILKFELGGVTEVSESAAPPGLAYTKTHGAPGFADVNGDQADDLILGNEEGLWLYLNSGSGTFAQSEAQRLPSSSLPPVYSPVTESELAPGFVSTQPITRVSGQPTDLITVASPGFKGYSIQYLQNDGLGNFEDQTDKFIHGGETTYISETDENYVWMRRVFAFDRDGVQDIIARSAGGNEVSSQVFLNRDGEWHLGLKMKGWTIENATYIRGKPVLLISNTQSMAVMEYPQ